ncbi:ribosome maturation protein RimP [Sphingomonadaceae bacterium]|nr:ribosome maturation protein RimP [Sphingomonadaceae bacterium]
MADLARLEEIVAPEAAALGFDLVRVKMMASEAGDGEQGLQIMAEDPATGQLLIEQCAALSRAISAKMEVLESAGETLVEGTYHLEVSSPGIDRPLTRAKDFANWAGHEVKISLAEKLDGQRSVKGDLIGIDAQETITVEDKHGKTLSFPRNTIHSAKLVLTNALIAATKPLDTAGADEITEDTEEKADD